MSEANADRRVRATSVDEWRMEVAEPSGPVAGPSRPGGDWSRAAAGHRRERVSADLESWREELTERMRRLEERLDDSEGARN